MATAVEIARDRVATFADRVQRIRQSLHQVVVGQDTTIDLLMTCALTGSHALLIGVPGLAKTLMVKALASAFEWKFARVQFTPDLMPSDITGYELLGRDMAQGEPTMVFRRGPVFCNLLLADEINRAPPKTQSALLESMAERHVTVGGQTYLLDDPFLVVATQNPIEQEGTYPLPEAQLDRFMMEIRIAYPTPEQEEQIVLATTSGAVKMPEPAFDRAAFIELRELVWAVPVAKSVAAYAVRLCGGSRREDARATPMVKQYVSWARARAAARTSCWRARPTRSWTDARRRPPKMCGRWRCPCCGTGSSSTIGRSAMR
jgi:MoxR-like ATPase